MKKQKVWTEQIKIPRIGRPPLGDKAMTQNEHRKKHREKKRHKKQSLIGVIDFETDPFDNVSQAVIRPFVAVIYADEFDPIVIWDENSRRFVRRLLAALEGIPESYTWYAHNGGKFDFMFLIHKLRGAVSFKGRGIMEAHVHHHTLRDSFHVIPERLANYKKDAFNYDKNKRAVRKNHRQEIIDYCISDCRYLLDILKKFVGEFGMKLSIGQAAMAELRKHYDVGCLNEKDDAFLRQWFYGGRVECLQGRGRFSGDYKLYDLNSAYPDSMARHAHPVGDASSYNYRTGEPGPSTIFIDLDCDNRGALIGRTDDGQTTATIEHGRFYTTIWEYKVALAHGRISNVEFNYCVDSSERTDFSQFVLPLYERRMATKRTLAQMKRDGTDNGAAFLDVKKDDIFLKLLLNNAYGKFAQNPRNFKEHWLTDPGEQPPAEWMASIEKIWDRENREAARQPSYENDDYWIWSKPVPRLGFNNVGTAASITGAVRAVLLDAICRAIDPIYCDTDSIIARDLPGVPIDKEALGAWDIEDRFSTVLIAGKKLYSTEFSTPRPGPDGQIARYAVKSKGTAGLTWDNMVALLDGAEIPVTSKGPTLDRYGGQNYLTRTIRATAEQRI